MDLGLRMGDFGPIIEAVASTTTDYLSFLYNHLIPPFNLSITQAGIIIYGLMERSFNNDTKL